VDKLAVLRVAEKIQKMIQVAAEVDKELEKLEQVGNEREELMAVSEDYPPSFPDFQQVIHELALWKQGVLEKCEDNKEG